MFFQPLEQAADERILPERAEGFRDELETTIDTILLGARFEDRRHLVLAAEQGGREIALWKSSRRPFAARGGDAPGDDFPQLFLNGPTLCLVAQASGLTDLLEK